MKTKIIVLTVADRPHYLSDVIESFRLTNHIKDYKLIASVEPINSKSNTCLEMLKKIDFMEVDAYMNAPYDPILKMVRNTHNVMTKGLEQTDFLIYTEDDCTWAPDLLEYLEWGKNEFKDDKKIFSINGFSHNQYDPSKTKQVYRRNHFHAMTFGVWKDTWQPVLDGWNWQVEPGWDIDVDRRFPKGRLTVYPHLSRVEHIGLFGTHVCDRNWHDNHIYNPNWGSNTAISDEQWYEGIEDDSRMDP